jgi:hypothetical protein
MNTRSSKRRGAMARTSRALALLSFTALALAASPAALADERGGPGTPSAQQLTSSGYFPLVPKAPLRLASWSD